VLPRTASSQEPARIQRARAASDATSTTTSTTTPPAPTPPPPPPPAETTLPTPEDVPDPSVIRPIGFVGRIQIPKIGLDAELRDQITQQSIDLGPSHWPGTAMPGGYGNAVIAGHRNSHTAPFHDAANLVTGDPITLVDALGRSFTYHVTEMFVVDPTAMWITEQTPGHTLTIFTCHPLGSSAQRLVIRATLG
jgi:sortase A